MDLKDFIICLKKVDTKTPITIDFDTSKKKKKKNIYGQKVNRWWDNLENCEDISSQKYHVLGHFLCWYYQGAPSKCPRDNSECKECYSKTLKGLDLKDALGKSGGKNPVSRIFNSMKRPEMYIYIAEALGILEEEELKIFVDDIKKAIDNSESWKKVINKGWLWDRVERNTVA